MIVVGRFALFCCLLFSLGAVLLLALGVRRRRDELMRWGYLAVYGLFFSAVVAGAVLLEAFLSRDFTFAYVAQNSDASLSIFYRIAGFWAGEQGSFLLWTVLLAIVAVTIALRNVERIDRLTAAVVAVLAAVAAVFSLLMVADQASNPFVAAAPGTAGEGLNPLLLHPAMVLHPPALFAAYAALTVPFAYATGVLLLGDTGRSWARERPALGGGRLAVPVARHRPGRLVGLRRALVGRLLGLGSGREHLARALAHRHRPGALADRLPAPRAAAALDARPGLRHLLVHDRRHLDDAHRPGQLGARLPAQRDARSDPLRPGRRRGGRLGRPARGALAAVRRGSGSAAGRGRRACAHRPERRAQRAGRGPAGRHHRRAARRPEDRRSADLSPGRPAGRRRRRAGARALPAALPGPPRRSRHLARPALAAAGRRRRAARAAADRRLARQPVRPLRSRGLLLCGRRRRRVGRGKRAAGRR